MLLWSLEVASFECEPSPTWCRVLTSWASLSLTFGGGVTLHDVSRSCIVDRRNWSQQIHLRLFIAPCPDATFFCNRTSFRKLSRIFFHLRWTSLPGSKKQSTMAWYCHYLQVPYKWQQFPFITSWIPAWSHNHSQNCKGHARSNMGRSASCVYHRNTRTTGYD